MTSAELLALAAIGEGKYAQAFPSFGPERRGAPVVAFCRLDDHPVRIRANIYEPDIVVVLDSTLLRIVNVAAGLKPTGIVVTNSRETPEKVKEMLKISNRLAVVDATKIAMECLGVPITNTTMLGALIRATGIVQLDSLTAPLKARFGRGAERNLKALRRAFSGTQIQNKGN